MCRAEVGAEQFCAKQHSDDAAPTVGAPQHTEAGAAAFRITCKRRRLEEKKGEKGERTDKVLLRA